MQHGNSPRPRGLLLEVQNWPPKKSSNYYWHRAIAASTAMSVTGVVPWSLSRPAIWSTKGMSIHSPNKALSCGGHNRLEWGRWDPRINMQTDWDSIMHVSSLFYWWMQLSPLWTQNVSHWPLYLQKTAMINHHLHLNHKISQHKQWATGKALLTPDYWHFCICLVRAMCCPVQSSDLKTHSFATVSLQNDCPFRFKYIGLNSKIQRKHDNVWCVKVLQAPWLQLFCIQTAMGFHAIVYITRQHCFWVHSIGEKGLMELLMKRWCPNFPWKFWIIYNYIGRNPKQPPGMYETL